MNEIAEPDAVVAPVNQAAGVQVTVLLPAFNEERAIRGVLEEIVEALAGETFEGEPLDYEILVVDDGSTDRTAEVVEDFAKETCAHPERILDGSPLRRSSTVIPDAAPPLRLIRCGQRRGAGAARKAGIRAARGEFVVMLDADGSYPAAAIPQLLPWLGEYDQVNGARTSERGTHPSLRAAVKWAIRMLACALTGTRIPDLNTGLKAFRREAMLPFLPVVPEGFSCVTSMTLAFLLNGYSVKYVPIEYRPRIGQSKFRPVRDTLRMLWTVLRLVFYFRLRPRSYALRGNTTVAAPRLGRRRASKTRVPTQTVGTR